MDTRYILWPELPPDEPKRRLTRRRLLVLGSKAAAGAAALFGGVVSFTPSEPFAQSTVACLEYVGPCTNDCLGVCVSAFLGPSCCDAGNPSVIFCCGCAANIKGCPPMQVRAACAIDLVIFCCQLCP